MVTPDNNTTAVITGRCYCGATTIRATEAPLTIAYCHCIDCRRVTGAPVAAFAAFDEAAVTFTPNEGQKVSVNPGVERSFCAACGSPLTCRYGYLPGQVYIAVSLFDQAGDMAPHLHAHAAEGLSWLHIDDDLDRHTATARAQLIDAED